MVGIMNDDSAIFSDRSRHGRVYSLFVQSAGDGVDELKGIDRFCEMAIEPGAQGAVAVVHTGVSGQRDDRHISAARADQCAQFLNEFVAIRAGHGDIADDDVGTEIRQERKRIFDRCGERDGSAAFGERQCKQLTHAGFVVQHQDMQTTQALGRESAFARTNLTRGVLEGQRAHGSNRQKDGEPAPLPFAETLNFQLAAMQRDELMRDGQAEAEATMATPGAAVALSESFENVRQQFGSNRSEEHTSELQSPYVISY